MLLVGVCLFVGFSLFVVCRSLFKCSLFVDGCGLMHGVVRCLLFVMDCSLFVVCCCLLFVVR